jgi:hypothetical protein
MALAMMSTPKSPDRELMKAPAGKNSMHRIPNVPRRLEMSKRLLRLYPDYALYALKMV